MLFALIRKAILDISRSGHPQVSIRPSIAPGGQSRAVVVQKACVAGYINHRGYGFLLVGMEIFDQYFCCADLASTSGVNVY